MGGQYCSTQKNSIFVCTLFIFVEMCYMFTVAFSFLDYSISSYCSSTTSNCGFSVDVTHFYKNKCIFCCIAATVKGLCSSSMFKNGSDCAGKTPFLISISLEWQAICQLSRHYKHPLSHIYGISTHSHTTCHPLASI